MGNSKLNSGSIPSSIDIDELLEGIEGNKTKIKYLKGGMVYFLSLLSPDNYNQNIFKNGYRTLNGDLLNKVIGKGRSSTIIKILRTKNVIEIRPHRKGYYSRGYRFTRKYRRVELTTVDFSERISWKLNTYYTLGNENGTINSPSSPYSHVYDQFKEHNLDIDRETIQTSLKYLGNTLFNKSKKLTKYQSHTIESLFNYLGRIVTIVEDVQEKEDQPPVSPTNHRFNSSITSLPKSFRNYMRINGNPIGEVDFKCSQSFLLSTILNDEFLHTSHEGYNINTIYPELGKILINTKSSVPSNRRENPHYLLGVHLNDEDYTSIRSFTHIDFRNDFYKQIIKEGSDRYPDYIKSKKGFNGGREYIKKHMMSFLFENNEFYREEDNVIELLRKLYPGLCTFTERFNQYYTNTMFSILLQRTESYLVLKKICKSLYEKDPSVPFFTIHDSIVTIQSKVKWVEKISHDIIYDITGKDVGLESKLLNPPKEIPEDHVCEIWDKIRITSQTDHYSKKHNFLYGNIIKGIDLLFSWDDNKYWRRKMNVE